MKRMRTILMTTLVISCISCLTFALCACAEQKSQDPTRIVESSPKAPDATQAAEESSAYSVVGTGDASSLVTNATGYDVVGIRIKPASASEYTAQNTFDGFEFKEGDTVELRFTEDDAATSYDVLLLTSKDSKIAVRNIDLVNAKDIVFHFEEGIGFITYTDQATGESFDNQADAIEAEENEEVIAADLISQAD